MTIKKISFTETKSIIAERLNVIQKKTITNYPNLSLTTARTNHVNIFEEILHETKSKHDNIVQLKENIKQKLSTVNSNSPNHLGNDIILIEISQLLLNHQTNSQF